MTVNKSTLTAGRPGRGPPRAADRKAAPARVRGAEGRLFNNDDSNVISNHIHVNNSILIIVVDGSNNSNNDDEHDYGIN